MENFKTPKMIHESYSKRGYESKKDSGVFYNHKEKQWYMFLGEKNKHNLVAIPNEVARIVKVGLYIYDREKRDRVDNIKETIPNRFKFTETALKSDHLNCHKIIYSLFYGRNGILKSYKDNEGWYADAKALFDLDEYQVFQCFDRQGITNYVKKIFGEEKFGIIQFQRTKKFLSHSCFAGISQDGEQVLCFEKQGGSDHPRISIISLEKVLYENRPYIFVPKNMQQRQKLFVGAMKYSDFIKKIETGFDPTK